MFIFKTIRTKIIVTIFTVFIVSMSIHSAYQFHNMKVQAFDTFKSVNTTINTILAEFISAYIYTKDIKNIKSSIDNINSIYIKSIYILDENSKVISKSENASDLKEYPRFQELLEREDKTIVSQDEYIMLNTFDILDIPIGYMVVEADLQSYKDQLEKERNTHLVETVMFSVVFLLAAIVLANSVSAPIEHIVKKLQNAEADDILVFDKQSQEEFQYLSANISRSHNKLRLSKINLESLVQEKTQELQDLNATLEIKVQESIAEAQHKSEMLQKQSRMAQMGEMISMIAHQWRQPLGAISAVVGNIIVQIELEKFDLTSEEGRTEHKKDLMKNLSSISSFVQSLTTTIDDFRNFYKPNKQQDFAPINDAIEKSLKIIKTSLVADDIDLIEDYASTQELYIYTNELMQVILNIVKNAEDNFNEKGYKGASISIKTYDVLDKTVIEIQDNGGGIPEDIIDNIFDPYFSTKDDKNGTGLGLYMSKTIVEEHNNGKIFAKNINEGVCFVIELYTNSCPLKFTK